MDFAHETIVGDVRSMKRPFQIILIALSLLMTGVVFVPSSRSQQNQTAAPAVEQYKILDLSKYTNVSQLEGDLNKLGADGWKVRTSTPGGFLVLARAG